MTTTSDYDLQFNNASELEQYWRSLPQQAAFTLRVSRAEAVPALEQLEALGGCGMLFQSLDGHDLLIAVMKGKRGPCYQTGRQARLKLDVCAALDDDGHLLHGSVAVCEKTAGILQQEQYQPFVEVSDADPELMQRYEKDPQPFDCDAFEELAQQMFDSLGAAPAAADDGQTFCYAGPFQLLIAGDGSMLWRGKAVRINAALAESLKAAAVATVDLDVEAAAVEYFQDVYKEQGAACLLGTLRAPEETLPAKQTDWAALANCSPAFQERLQRLLDEQQDYFIVIGSDPGDPLGCCPSDDVAQANLLVKAGILDRRQQSGSGDACPISVYACAREIDSNVDELHITQNKERRGELATQLRRHAAVSTSQMTRWILIIFIFFTLLLGMVQLLNDLRPKHSLPVDETLAAALQPERHVDVIVCLFREQQRCNLCLNMERQAGQTLADHFKDDSGIVFRSLNVDLPEYEALEEQLNMFTSTLVLFKCADGKVLDSRLIEEAWYLQDDPTQFREQLRRHIVELRTAE